MNNPDHFKYNYNIIEELKQVPMLKSFEEKDIQNLLGLSEIREYNPGDLIFEEGSYDGCMYYLVYGKAKIIKNEKELSVLKRTGEIFGEMGVLSGSSRSASVYAADNTMCLAININDIEGLSIKDQYEFRYRLYRGVAEVLADRLRVTTDELVRAREELEKQNLVNRLIKKSEELVKAMGEIERLKNVKRET
ncbi:cyclic nucleotide-binding domain-containing protein [Desulfococcaceae bacterium HSG8]|nr:cyclic nucleotide-binding domain-containing protein [Desulfococcaceae bacterium HSG8]